MITQDTISVGDSLIRQYAANGRYAHVTPLGQVFCYPDWDALCNDGIEREYLDRRSTNAGNDLAITYVLHGGK